MNTQTIKLQREPNYIDLLQDGNQKGLNHFYKNLYPKFYNWSFRRVKEDVAASSITHEAFLKLWLLRQSIHDHDKLLSLLKIQVRIGCTDFYRKNSTSFHRNLIRLDDIDSYQEWLAGYNPEDEIEFDDVLQQQELDAEKASQWLEVKNLFPILSNNQQEFIKLCLHYNFSYERIAFHLGGISNYEVGKEVDRTIEALKNIIIKAKQLNITTTKKAVSFEGNFSEEEAAILKMRYDLQLSFEEIAKKLGLCQKYIQKTFVTAYLSMKKK